jgi:hypothetical protein
MRYVHVHTSCGGAMPARAKAADDAIAEQGRDAQLAKGRRRPVVTEVGRYVERKAPGLARRLDKVLQRHARRVSAAAAALFERHLAKDDTARTALLQRILEELNLDQVGVDINGELATALLEAFRRAAALGATQVGFSIEDITDQLDDEAMEWVLEHGGELVKDLAGTTREILRTTLANAVQDGDSPAALAKEIMKVGAFSAARALMIARTELARAHVAGNVQGWRDSGEVVGKRWLLADTHPAPDECDDAADKGQVDLEAEFLPGLTFPPAHPNCLCDVLPVLRDEKEPP